MGARAVVAAYEEGVAAGEGAVGPERRDDRPARRRAGAASAGEIERTSAMSATETAGAPKDWRGRFYEDFDVGDVYRSRLGRTITETDNIWFTCLTLNTNQMHFNTPYTERTRFGQPLVNIDLHARARHRADRAGHERERRPRTSPGRTSSCRSPSSSATRCGPRARSSTSASRSRTRTSGSSRCAAAGSTSGARS